jgi:hypothetical protein
VYVVIFPCLRLDTTGAWGPFTGAVDRTRTCDLRFTKALLYQLSYNGLKQLLISRSKFTREVCGLWRFF